jgi:hypothetical protein
VLAEGDLAAHDDDHAGTDLAGRNQAFACAEDTPLAETAQPLDLGRVEGREHLIAACAE